MPEKRTLERAERDREEGKAPTTQAGEFVREEMEHVKEGKHAVRNPKQAIAIGLSKARRSGVNVPPKRGSLKVKSEGRASAYRAGKRSSSGTRKKTSKTGGRKKR